MQGIKQYAENRDALTIEDFVIHYRPLVKKIALYIKRSLPKHVELDDLLQSGLLGLLEARSNFKPNRQASFETFASIRIRGSMIDALRKNSWVSREIVKNMKKIATATTKIEQRNQKSATPEEIARELGISFEEHSKMTQEISVLNMVSLDEIDQDQSSFGDDEFNPSEINQREAIKKQLKQVLDTLPEREKLVLSLYYVDEFTFKQIGEILDLTEARICQLHAKAIDMVRNKMTAN